MSSPVNRLGVDTGGTFTDFVLLRGSSIVLHKVASTPEAPERAILEGADNLGLTRVPTRLTHGSTVATNAVLEGEGARTVYVTNRGFADVLSIGRQAREALYDLQPAAVAPPVPPDLCIETGGRIGADGTVLEPLTDEDIAALLETILGLAPEAVAINLLFSYKDDRAERRIEAALPKGLFVSRSSEVLPEYREYERGIATWLNASVGPRVAGYIDRLEAGMPAARVEVTQSDGRTMDATNAAQRGAHLLLSGPAGGLVGARFMAGLAGVDRLMTLDMGGTSTDVALIVGEIARTTEGSIGRYPVALPMVDMHTIGAGGGSIARLDAAGMLQVGPRSAGASPGPVCYARGGISPTVTDANLTLGRIHAPTFLGGRMSLDRSRAREAFAPMANAMECTIEEAAAGVVALAEEHMVAALRVISVQRGHDPKDFTLCCFGGAGGLHVCGLADAIGTREAMVPAHAGVLSALGMVVAVPGRERSRTLAVRAGEVDAKALEAGFGDLEAAAITEMCDEGHQRSMLTVVRSLDLRYFGQSASIAALWSGIDRIEAEFHAAHEARYGHRLPEPVEIVNLRVEVTAPAPEVEMPVFPAGGTNLPTCRVEVVGHGDDVPVYLRDSLGAGMCLIGPAILAEDLATTWVAPGWTGEIDEHGNLMLRRGG